MPATSVLGLSAFYHDSACCLLRNGQLVAAAAEERFSRVKHDPRLPVESFRYCLDAGKVGIDELSCIAFYESHDTKYQRQIATGRPAQDPRRVEMAIREGLGFEGRIVVCDHHRSHAASAFYFSGFDEAGVLIVDGVGEWTTTSYWRGSATGLELIEEVRFPHSLGLFYATITSYLGFRVNRDELKVMGLAAYGQPTLVDRLRALVTSSSGGAFELVMEYFDFIQGRRMYSDRLIELLGQRPRDPASEITDFHRNLARSLQVVLEELLLEKVDSLAKTVGSDNLCLAGGVALNCVANGRIVRESTFKSVFIQPAAGDSGASLGAAALAYESLTEESYRSRLDSDLLGPSFTSDEIADLLAHSGLVAEDYRDQRSELVQLVVDRLLAGEIVGWFSGRMELGPRALGARSILANPLDARIRERLNSTIKRRESFRPFAPAVLLDQAAKHFELDHPSPFMLEACRVSSPLALPAVTHIDGSARPQTVDRSRDPKLGQLIEAFFRRSGCPMLLNTSFNVAGEPIVCSPRDALCCFIDAKLDILVLEDFFLERETQTDGWVELVRDWRPRRRSAFDRPDLPDLLGENLYSFS